MRRSNNMNGTGALPEPLHRGDCRQGASLDRPAVVDHLGIEQRQIHEPRWSSPAPGRRVGIMGEPLSAGYVIAEQGGLRRQPEDHRRTVRQQQVGVLGQFSGSTLHLPPVAQDRFGPQSGHQSGAEIEPSTAHRVAVSDTNVGVLIADQVSPVRLLAADRVDSGRLGQIGDCFGVMAFVRQRH